MGNNPTEPSDQIEGDKKKVVRIDPSQVDKLPDLPLTPEEEEAIARQHLRSLGYL